MPKQYEKVRDKIAKGAGKGTLAYDKAQSQAAAIFVGEGKTKKARSQRAKALRKD